MNDAFLSPIETATRLGISAKALRVYERHGLIDPLRTVSGWRTYGPDQLARLHVVLALKQLGLPLKKIADLVNRGAALEAVLDLHEKILARERGHLDRALAAVRTARAKLAAGQALSVQDLATLAKETSMTPKPTDEEMKAVFAPLIDRHFSAQERADLAQKSYDQTAAAKAWDDLIAKAKTLMIKGDPGSPEALALARRWKALVDQFTGGNPALAQKATAVWKDAFADPAAAPKLTMNVEVMAFMGKAMSKLREGGE